MISSRFIRKLLFLLLISSTFLSLESFRAFAEGNEVKLDYIAVNNIVVSDSEDIVIKKDDIIKVAGIGNPGQEVIVSFLEKEFGAIVDKDGNWFILFSIQDLPKDLNTVKMYIKGDKVNFDAANFVNEKGLEEKVSNDKTKNKDVIKVIFIAIVCFLLILSSVPILFYWLKGLKRKKLSKFKTYI